MALSTDAHFFDKKSIVPLYIVARVKIDEQRRLANFSNYGRYSAVALAQLSDNFKRRCTPMSVPQA
jgi:hypothetical protein